MYIANNADLKVAYEELIFWKNDPRLKDNVLVNDKIKELKEGIRDYFRRMNRETARIIKWDFESEIIMEEIPELINTKEAAEEWFMSCRYREVRPSIYDCTGQLFTAWHKIYKRNGKYIVYYCVCRDVQNGGLNP